jgi:hypothetical protein
MGVNGHLNSDLMGIIFWSELEFVHMAGKSASHRSMSVPAK